MSDIQIRNWRLAAIRNRSLELGRECNSLPNSSNEFSKAQVLKIMGVRMNFAFWRYQLILGSLFIFWVDFFVSGGSLNQLAFNFAIFYPLGFLVGYRRKYENLGSAYLAAFVFNLLSYLMAYLAEVPIESWTMVLLDFTSLVAFLNIGMYIGRRAQSKE